MNLKHTPLLFALAALATVTLAQEKKAFPDRERTAPPNREEMREKMMLKRFDKDGDGKLSAEEKTAMENEKKETITKFDKDGDGKLSAEERKAMMDERKATMDKFDADKDGKLNEEERAKLQEHLKTLAAEDPA